MNEQPDFKLGEFLPYRLAVAAQKVSREFSRRYGEKFGLSIPEWRVLAHLSQSDAVSVRDIHERVDMDKPKVSRAGQKLEAAGYVSKRVDACDKRLVKMELTAKGRKLMRELVRIAEQYQSELESRLGRELAVFSKKLEEISGGGK